jgi:hypothetical protein
MSIDIAVLGTGKIAREPHLPTIAGVLRFWLAATISRSGGIDGALNYGTVEAMIAAQTAVKRILPARRCRCTAISRTPRLRRALPSCAKSYRDIGLVC